MANYAQNQYDSIGMDITFEVNTGGISQNCFVVGVGDKADMPAGAKSAVVIGVALEDAAAGEYAPIRCSGFATVIAGEDLSSTNAGTMITNDTDGKAVVITSAGHFYGRLIEGAASGELCTVDLTKAGYYHI
jgi:hypothetical protein